MANVTVYKVIYFNELNLVTCKDFSTESEARLYMSTLDYARLVRFVTSRNITDITDVEPTT